VLALKNWKHTQTYGDAKPVACAAAQGGYAGLDPVNVSPPAKRKGRGQLVVTVTVNDQATSLAQLLLQQKTHDFAVTASISLGPVCFTAALN